MAAVEMQAAIAAIWQKGLPKTRERLALLQNAAEDLSTSRTIDGEQRADAISAAHTLAGSLGMFGLHAATEHARAIEQTLDHDGLPQPERLEEQVAALMAALQPSLGD
jgi:HPt (histidine-containing phosphotransfer) domain-containing protein